MSMTAASATTTPPLSPSEIQSMTLVKGREERVKEQGPVKPGRG